MSVLALDISGIPRQWISNETAITYHAKGMVAWSFGKNEWSFFTLQQTLIVPVVSLK